MKKRKGVNILKKNMGTVDRVVRAIFAVVVAILYFSGSISGTAAVILGVLAVIMLLTSISGVCPPYGPLGISTMKKEGK
jgi:ABC-type lipoprotein release transport system permease subunit